MCLAAYYAAYLIRFDVLARSDMAAFRATAWWIVLLKLASLFSFKLYRGMWRYTGVHDLLNLLKALAVASALVVFGLLSLYRFEGFSRGVIVVDFLLCVVSLGGYRLGVRVLANSLWGEEAGNGSAARLTKLKRLVVIGAGSAGEKLVREVRENRRLSYDVVGLVDDNLSKLRLTIHGVPVLGPVKNLAAIVQDRSIDELIIAAPSATAAEMRKMVDHCKGAGIPFKTVPGIGELIEGRISVNALREVRYEDLLGRQQVEIDASEIGRYVTGKRVMVTGAAGSIGSELCRQIGGFDPELLLLVDRNESGLFDIEMEFAGKFPRLHVVPVLAALQNFALMQRFFGQYEPHVVFHAAAYKHVPMMELHPWEAVFNNIVATKSLLDLCFRNDVEKCVIVSTDKAVRPSNIMGACKRVTELLSQAYAREVRSPVYCRTLRECYRKRGQCCSLVQEADCGRGAPDGDAQGDDPLFHDDPGSVPPYPAGGRPRKRRGNIPPQDGYAHQDRCIGAGYDHPLGVETGRRHSHRLYRAEAG